MTDQEPIAAAILAALTSAGLSAYDVDKVPGTNANPGPIPERLVTIELSRDPNDSYRFGGGHNSIPTYFLELKYRARAIQHCREMRRVAFLTLEGQTVGAYGPFVFNQETQPIDFTDGVGAEGADTFRFA